MCLAKPLCVKSEWLSIRVDYEITQRETNIIDKNNISTCSWNKADCGDKKNHQPFEELHAETQGKSHMRSVPLGIIKAHVLHLDIKGLTETSNLNVMHVLNSSHQLHKSHLSLSAQPRSINIVFKGGGGISRSQSQGFVFSPIWTPMRNKNHSYECVGRPGWMFALIAALEHGPPLFIQLGWKPLRPCKLLVAPTKPHTRDSEWLGQDVFYPHPPPFFTSLTRMRLGRRSRQEKALHSKSRMPWSLWSGTILYTNIISI